MKIKWWQVEHWQGIAERRIDIQPSGLNVIYGPNESGKSRLFNALYCGLLEAHTRKTSHLKDTLMSWDRDEAPKVTVCFEIDGSEYEITKTFLKKPSALLKNSLQTWKGDEAEAKLQELLGCSKSTSRGDRDHKHDGLWALLWVKQGFAGNSPGGYLNDDPRHQLENQLSSQTGHVGVSEHAQAVFDKSKIEYERFYNLKSETERGDLKENRAKLKQAESNKAEAERKRATAYAEADAYERARKESAKLKPKLDDLKQELTTAKGKADKARELKAAVELRSRDVNLMRLELDQAEAAHKKRAENQQDLVAKRADANQLAAKLKSDKDTVEHLNDKKQAADNALVNAEAEQQKAKTAHEIAKRAQEKQGLLKEQSEKSEALKKARVCDQTRLDIDKELSSLGITEAKLEALRKLQNDYLQAKAVLDGAAAHLVIDAKVTLPINGESLEAGQCRRMTIDDTTPLSIGDVATLTITPGGTNLPKLRDALRDNDKAYQDELASLAVDSLDDAIQKVEDRRGWELKLAKQEILLANIAKDGTDALLREAEALQNRIDALGEVSDDTLNAEAAEQCLGKADAAVTKCRTQRDSLQPAMETAQKEFTEATTRQEGLASACGVIEGKLAQLDPEDVLIQKQTGAKKAWQEAVALSETTAEEYQACGGDDSAMDVERLKKAYDNHEKKLAENERQIIELHTKLESAKELNLHEDCQEADNELEQAQQLLESIERRALAAKRLFEVLNKTRDAAQQALTAPVVAAMQPLLDKVMPGRSVEIGDNWTIAGLRGKDGVEPFEQLSGGAKEQLSLCVRVGLAKVLAKGGSLPLIFDDSMVNCDDDRAEALCKVLYHAAADGLQVIMLSCHERHLASLGEDHRVNLSPRVM